MAEGNVLLCGCPNCQRAVTPTPQAAKAGWYQCTRCGLFYQSHHGCGCALAAAESRERALREAVADLLPLARDRAGYAVSVVRAEAALAAGKEGR